ncbi:MULTISPECIES: GGDEF domain-containing protein [unclassified Coleofasciculus]|uniref:GGDEF domain-containing protein n=1 Tax=unclassified Coleofasciculus TaxID=2692782 RepID=UPI0018814842|nr:MULTISPECIES: diguanylate cyclase [unclassified Coleofasciculus]MBE9128081.1 diguanylate cyclase [Coleofasciculus sp. LEGE 07081]MBE9146954.1 diguanylate cyclase [Coleofasciculus sp. LEGE 07092]
MQQLFVYKIKENIRINLPVNNDICNDSANNRFWQHVVQTIATAVKCPADLVAHYGSGRFAVILSNTQAEGAVCLAEEIRFQIKAIEIDSAHCQFRQSLTASLGVASVIPSRDYSPTLLLTAAAQALYQAKVQGCDRVILYETLLRQTQFAR